MPKNFKIDYLIINILFAAIPVSMIIGTSTINQNIILYLMLSIIFFYKKKINFKLNTIDKLITIFFFYTLIVFFFNYLQIKDSENLLLIFNKTFLYLRFFIFYFVTRILIEKKILNLKFFNYICAFSALLVCLDIYVQFSFGKNALGFEPISQRHFSGFFKEELIAGGYLQKLGFFTFIVLSSYKKIKHKILTQILIFFLLTFGIILSGNRMPLILFITASLIYMYFNSNLKIYLKKIVFFIFIFLFLLFNFNPFFKTNLQTFYNDGIFLVDTIFNKDTKKLKLSEYQKPYISEFICAKRGIREKFIFGGGIRSYRTISKDCNTHPHNYYLEVFVDLGLVGLLFFLAIFINIFKNINLNNINNQIKPYYLLLAVEFFPFRTSGSIFSTSNSLIIFLSIAVMISSFKKDNFKKDE